MENNLDLLLQAKNGDDHAKEKLIEQNLGLVWSVARRFTGRGYDIEDLFQIGCIGLIKCIDKFSFEYDVKFSTYAVPLIQGEIRRFLRDSGAIKVSRSLKEMNMKVEQYRQKIKKEKGYEPEITEIAAALSFDAGDIVMAMEASMEIESLDTPGVLISVILTGFNLYKKIAKYGGAGALVPITGFANGVCAPVIEFQTEGEVFGKGVKCFTIAGPVIMYGIFVSWGLGVIYWICKRAGWV